VLRPKIEADVKYLYHYLRQLRLPEGGYDRHFKYLKRNTIALPPLPEQRRIAAILDKADELRAKRRAALKKLDELTHSIFLDMFGDPATNPKGWPMVHFASVVYFQEGPGVRNWQFRKEGIKLINVKNIVDGKLVIENTDRYLSPDEVKQKYQHFLLDAGDLVVASSGVTWGKIAEVYPEHLPLCLNTSMIRLRPQGKNIEKTFIRAFVESQAFRNQIVQLITGSAQPNFGPAHLKQVRIPLPPIETQRNYTKRVAAIQELRDAQHASAIKLDILFASLQQRAFRGEL
jgi:restriction endonuclease S subunit